MIAVNFRPKSEQFFKVQLNGSDPMSRVREELRQGLCAV
jgi:hypothetical protein